MCVLTYFPTTVLDRVYVRGKGSGQFDFDDWLLRVGGKALKARVHHLLEDTPPVGNNAHTRTRTHPHTHAPSATVVCH